MKKSEIQKEVAAIRKLRAQADKLEAEIRPRQKALAKATCPFKPGDVVEWIWHSGKKVTGKVREVFDSRIAASGSPNLWSIYVNKYSPSSGRLLRDYSVLHASDSYAASIKVVPEVIVARDTPIYRPLPWINLKTGKEMFGIQISVTKGKWQHLAENGKPCVYPTAKERDAKLKELRSKK
jgi:hypothetical protein